VTARRSFEYIDGESEKFWEIWREDRCHYVRFGRIGSAGQRRDKYHVNPLAAQAAVDKLIASKLAKGYVETTRPTERRFARGRGPTTQSNKPSTNTLPEGYLRPRRVRKGTTNV